MCGGICGEKVVQLGREITEAQQTETLEMCRVSRLPVEEKDSMMENQSGEEGGPSLLECRSGEGTARNELGRAVP
jgi:hypothetical protein